MDILEILKKKKVSLYFDINRIAENKDVKDYLEYKKDQSKLRDLRAQFKLVEELLAEVETIYERDCDVRCP